MNNTNKRKTTIIAIANEKGGVGKTTTAINVSAGLSKLGKKVLAVDLDCQSSFSQWVGFSSDGKPTIAELIVSSVGNMMIDYNSFVRHYEKENFDYIPAFEQSMKGISSYLASKSDCTNILKNIFNNDFFTKYDFIIFDCSPASDLLETNAFSACHKLLVPVQADVLSYTQVEHTIQSLVNSKNDNDISKYLLGFLPTIVQKGTRHSNEILNALTESYGDFVLPQYITQRTEVKNSVVFGVSSVNTPKSKAGEEYMNVVHEILKRCEM